jgi:hypothetical protein
MPLKSYANICRRTKNMTLQVPSNIIGELNINKLPEQHINSIMIEILLLRTRLVSWCLIKFGQYNYEIQQHSFGKKVNPNLNDYVTNQGNGRCL